MRLATTTGDFSRCTPDNLQALECVARSGFEYVDYNFDMDYARRGGIYSEDVKGYLSKLKEKCHETGIRLVQAHAPMGAPLKGDEDFIRDTVLCIEACGELGIKNLVVHSGYLADISKSETFQKNKLFYEGLLHVAERYDVNILTENFNKMCVDNMYWIDNAADLLELIQYVDHPLFHAVWDTGHANMQNMSQEEAIVMLGSHVKALHVQDNDGKDDLHMCPLLGTMDVGSLMRGLRSIDYDGYFTFEATNFYNPVSLKKSDISVGLDARMMAERALLDVGHTILKNFWM